MSQNQSTSNQKRPAPAQNNKQAPQPNKPAQNQNRPAPTQKKPAQNPQKSAPNQKRPAPAPQKAPKTQAFNAVNNKNKGKNPTKPSKKLIIAACVVIVLILATVLVLIVGNIMNKIQHPTTQDPNTTIYVEKSADDIKIGNLLLINQKNQFDYTVNGLVATDYITLPNSIENLWAFKNNSANNTETKIKIPGTDTYAPTYELGKEAVNIALDKTTLKSFNQMMLDYCNTLNLSSYTEGSASKINVAWGWSHSKDLYGSDAYKGDIYEYGETFYNQADGKSITLQSVTHGKITESILKNDFSWIYNHCHEYGFIIRFPDSCQEHTGFNSKERLHLRYVGVEHATYIYENGCCLEKYLELLRTNHGYNNPLTFNANGKEYQVYYVQYNGNPTQIPVPKDSTHTISGDNMNGFIVTVEK